MRQNPRGTHQVASTVTSSSLSSSPSDVTDATYNSFSNADYSSGIGSSSSVITIPEEQGGYTTATNITALCNIACVVGLLALVADSQ